jgi:hypothetical protein
MSTAKLIAGARLTVKVMAAGVGAAAARAAATTDQHAGVDSQLN